MPQAEEQDSQVHNDESELFQVDGQPLQQFELDRISQEINPEYVKSVMMKGRSDLPDAFKGIVDAEP